MFGFETGSTLKFDLLQQMRAFHYLVGVSLLYVRQDELHLRLLCLHPQKGRDVLHVAPSSARDKYFESRGRDFSLSSRSNVFCERVFP